jgi:hypothetical protein
VGKQAWVVLVTDGTTLEAAPEVYMDKLIASKFARNWAWFLSARGEFRIDEPFDGRLEIGHWDVRVVDIEIPVPVTELWIATHWTEDGYPDPEAIALPDREAAVAWASAPLGGYSPDSLEQSTWHVVAEFGTGRGEVAYSVAYVAKFVGAPLS